MKFGVTMFMTDQTIGPVELAREIEARGLHSLYVPEHTHIPTSRRTPPPTGDAELAEEYKRTLDPFVALAMAAAVDRAPRRRHRHLPGRAARPDRHRQGRRQPRSRVGRALRVRHRVRLERRRDRAPRRRHEAPARRRPRAHARDEGAVARRRRVVRRRVRAPRAVVVVAEARAPGRSADPHRRRARAEAVRARGRVRRRVDPDRRRRACAPRSPSSDARAKRAAATRRRCASCRSARSPTRASSSTTRRSASKRSCCGSPGGTRDRVLPRLDRLAELVE